MIALLLAPEDHRGLIVTPQRAARLARVHGFTRAGYSAARISRIMHWSEWIILDDQAWLRQYDDHMADIVRHGGTA